MIVDDMNKVRVVIFTRLGRVTEISIQNIPYRRHRVRAAGACRLLHDNGHGYFRMTVVIRVTGEPYVGIRGIR